MPLDTIDPLMRCCARIIDHRLYIVLRNDAVGPPEKENEKEHGAFSAQRSVLQLQSVTVLRSPLLQERNSTSTSAALAKPGTLVKLTGYLPAK